MYIIKRIVYIYILKFVNTTHNILHSIYEYVFIIVSIFKNSLKYAIDIL